ncbi:hypothetical protein GOC73_23660 [Sinorhizobium medicae]|nr:hypothetical protein [Sinorhizobium medicae]
MNLILPSLKLTREWFCMSARQGFFSSGLVASAETRIVLRNDEAAGAISSMVKIMCRRRANVADENFGCEPAKKNEEHDRSYDEEEKFTKHSGHSSDVKITRAWVRSGAPICLCGSFA